MFHARITIDLPSEPLPRTSRIARLLLSLLGSEDASGDVERLVGNALELLSAALSGMAAAGFDDVIAIVIDTGIYVDTEQRAGDVQQALDAVVRSGAMRRGFNRVQVVLSNRGDTLHTLAELEIREQVAEGQPELTIDLVARMTDIRVQREDGPRTYRERVRQWLADGGFDAQAGRVQTQTETLAHALSKALGGAETEIDGPHCRLVAPGPLQVGRFRHLGFGQRLRPPTYRAKPVGRRQKAHDHAHVHYYYDPYHDLLSWLMLEALRDGQWKPHGVCVVDAEGQTLIDSDAMPSPLPPMEVPLSVVTLGEEAIEVDPSIPSVGFDVAETGSPHTPGYGGDGSG